MENALVIGASGGIGAALVARLKAGGSAVTGLSRSTDGIDLTRPETIEAALGALAPPFHRVIVATGGLAIDGAGPEKALRQLDAEAMAAQFALNAIGPILVLRSALRLMPRDRPSHFCALSARVGSIGDNRAGGWYGYRAAKAALNQLVHSAAIEVARTHPLAVCVCLHPGTVDTPLTRPFRGRNPAVAPEAAARNLLAVMDGLGPEDTGGFFDWRGTRIPW